MLASYARNRRSRDKRGFYDPTLLLRCPSQPLPGRNHYLDCSHIAHEVIVGQIKPSVYTAITGRLRSNGIHAVEEA